MAVRPVLEDAISVAEYDSDEIASMLIPLIGSLRCVGCVVESYRLRTYVRYEGEIIAILHNDHDEHERLFEMDKTFARTHRPRLIEIALPLFTERKLATACYLSGAYMSEAEAARGEYEERAKRELNAFFDTAK